MTDVKVEAALQDVLEAREALEAVSPDCAAGRHLRSKGGKCKVCGVVLCVHNTFDLRGCQRPDGHKGLHSNGWANAAFGKVEEWSDSEGWFVTSKEIWVALIERLKNSGCKKVVLH